MSPSKACLICKELHNRSSYHTAPSNSKASNVASLLIRARDEHSEQPHNAECRFSAHLLGLCMKKGKSGRKVSCCHLSSCRCSESGGFNGAQRKIALARAAITYEPAHVSEGKKLSSVLPGGCSSAPSAIEYGALPHAQVLHDLALQALNEGCKAHVHHI